MADEVEMTPVAGAEPPKADSLAKPAATKVATLKLNPVPRSPLAGGAPTAALRPGLKLPPKPGATVTLKPGLKLPPKPGATVPLKPGLKLPPKPMIHKPGSTIAAAPLPKPISTEAPKPIEAEAPKAVDAPKPMEATKPAAAEVSTPVAVEASKPTVAEAPVPVEAAKPEPVAAVPKQVAPKPVTAASIIKPVIRKPGSTITAAPLPKPVTLGVPKPVVPAASAPSEPAKPAVEAAKPVSVDAQGVGKLPTVEAQAVARDDVKPATADIPRPIEALKTVTQKLKGITQEIPQQAILRKTGILAEGAMSESQKEAAKHKTARISLSDAMGVAPVKNENAPMKTIRIKRPIDIPGATKPLTPQPQAEAPAAEAPVADAAAPTVSSPTTTATITQRKTLKITRPSGAVRPAGKFGIKRPGATVAAAPTAGAQAADAAAPVGEIADIADIPDVPTMAPAPVATAGDGPAWLWSLSVLVQVAACVAIGALAWILYQNTQSAYF